MNSCSVCSGTRIVGAMAPCHHCVGFINVGFQQPDPTFPSMADINTHEPWVEKCMSPYGIPWDLAIPHELAPEFHYPKSNEPEIV